MNLPERVRHLAAVATILAALTGASCGKRPTSSPQPRAVERTLQDGPVSTFGLESAKWSVMLDVPLIGQETDEWCWAASAEMAMKFLGKDVSQCTQASKAFGKACCTTSACADSNPCVEATTPLFEPHGFHADPPQSCLSWEKLTHELSAGRPVLFTWNIGEGSHMMVARGAYIEGNSRWVQVNDPDPPCLGNDAPILYEDYVEGYDHTHGNDFIGIRRTQGMVNVSHSTPLNAGPVPPLPMGPGFKPTPDIQKAGRQTTQLYAGSVGRALNLPSGFNPDRVTYENPLPDAIVNRKEVQRYKSTDNPESFLHRTGLSFVPVNVDGVGVSVFVMKWQPGPGGGYTPIRLGNRPLARRLAAVNWKQALGAKTLGIVRVPFLHIFLLAGRKAGQPMALMLVSDDRRLGVAPGTWQTPDKILTEIYRLANAARP